MALTTPLTGKQRRFLRALGHHLEPVVQVGHLGVTEQVQQALLTALRDHELVKVKLAQSVDDRPDATEVLAEATSSECVQILGRTCLFYRPRIHDRKIILPDTKPPAPKKKAAKKVTKKTSAKKKVIRRDD